MTNPCGEVPLPDNPPDKMDVMSQLMHGFVIFGRLMPKGTDRSVAAEHDIIYAGPNPSTVNSQDIERLETLGWHPDYALDCFYHFT